jgi:hypothetical protein
MNNRSISALLTSGEIPLSKVRTQKPNKKVFGAAPFSSLNQKRSVAKTGLGQNTDI